MNGNQPPRISDDELDIEEFAAKLYRIGKRACFKLLFPVKLLFLKPVRFVLIMAICAGAAILLQLILPKTYEGTFLIKPTDKNDLTFLNDIHSLYLAAKDNDAGYLASSLNIPEELAQSIKKISVLPIKKQRSADTVDMASIEIRLTHPANFDSISKSVLRFLESSPHYSKVKALRTTQLADFKNKINSELSEIDSITRVLSNNMVPRNGGGFVYGEPINPVVLYEKELSLYRQKMGLTWDENYLDNFELLSSSPPTSKPYFPRLKYMLLICGFVGLVVIITMNYKTYQRSSNL